MTTFTTEGTVLKRGDAASPEVFTSIGQVTSISDFGSERAQIDVTSLDSTAKEYQQGLKDGVEFTVTIFYDPSNSQHTGIKSDHDNNTLRNFQLVLSDSPATTYAFAGRILAWKLTGLEPDQAIQMEITIKISGDITES